MALFHHTQYTAKTLFVPHCFVTSVVVLWHECCIDISLTYVEGRRLLDAPPSHSPGSVYGSILVIARRQFFLFDYILDYARFDQYQLLPLFSLGHCQHTSARGIIFFSTVKI